MKVEIEISNGFTQENYDALKVMMDAYIGEFIKANGRTTSYNPYPTMQNNNDLNFVVTFTKKPFIEYQQ